MESMFKFSGKRSIYGCILLRLLVLLILYQITRWLSYVENKTYFFDVDFDRYFTIMLGGIRFDLSAILYVNLLWIFLFLIPLKFKYSKALQRFSSTVYIAFNSVAIFSNFVDIVYYPFSNRRLTVDVFLEFRNETNLLGIVLNSIWNYWYLLLLFCFMVFILVRVAHITTVNVTYKGNMFPISFFVEQSLLFIIISTLVVFGLRGSFILNTRPIAVSNAGEYTSKPNQIYLVTNTPFFIIRNL